MTTATADPLVGRALEGRYRILRRIARGGMSTVYEAVDERLDRLVAVKVMSGALSADPAFHDRFSREARAAARLSHVNTVGVYDQGMDTSHGTNHVFLVMELVQGRTLRELIRERRGFSPAEAVSIMEPVLAALAAAHRAGIVHRDVKPENILLSDTGVVKVADFGLARAIDTDAEQTRTGLMMGTVAYCSPEQIARGEADPRSDVYSAGIVFFELLTGKPPYCGENPMNVAYQHVHSRVPAPSSKVRQVPNEIDELVVAATDSDPTGRPNDAAEFLAELAEVRAELGLPVVGIPPRSRGAHATPAQSAPGAASDPSNATAIVADVVPRSHRTAVIGASTQRTGSHRPGDQRDQGCSSQEGRNQASQVLRHDTRAFDPSELRLTAGSPQLSGGGGGRKRPRKEFTDKQRNRRRGVLILSILLILGVAAGVTGWWFASGRYSMVPDVRGQLRAVAEQTLKDAGYQLGKATTDYSHDIKAGAVIRTDIAGGSREVRGTTVAIVVSKGRHYATVPSIRAGSAKQDVITAYKKVGLSVTDWGEAFSTSVPAGGFVSADPKAGKKIEIGDAAAPVTITVTMSKGPDWVQIPAFTRGTKYEDLASTIASAELDPDRHDVFSDDVAAGTVISVDPSDRQVRGGEVVVNVSKGPEWVTVPDIKAGEDKNEAVAKIQSAGLQVEVEKRFVGPGKWVFELQPGAGTKLRPGDTVKLTVF